MPTGEDFDQMAACETDLCQALETDALAVLAAVLTLDGARQWVFYTRDIKECRARLDQMPEDSQYPIELDTFEDPDWEYLRNKILGNIPHDA